MPRSFSSPRTFLLTLALFIVLAACGIDTNVFGPPGTGGRASTSSGGPGGSSGVGGDGGDDRPPATADRVDLLLVVDNSRSMADKQEILSLAIPNLLRSFTNPRCVDAQGIVVDDQPFTASDPCPEGSRRQFAPITDLNVGVVTSSVGGHGADSCTGMVDPSENDRGRLISRAPGSGFVNTYDQLGFLAWDPNAERDPVGITVSSTLETNLKAIVLGAGQSGCGFEATMEAWYRFLVDPNPYESIEIQNGRAVLVGTDELVLEQRRRFLRPDSLLVITTLTDENDCSIRDGSQFYFAAQIFNPGNPSQLYRLPKARSECADDPNDPCCLSCTQPQGTCPVDPTCDQDMNGSIDTLPASADNINLRCWQQKRRFGIDFLYPVERYVNALNDEEVQDRDGNLEPNPLFVDLNPNDEISGVRDERLVFLTSLVGVPWQDIARRDENGVPDLESGLDPDGVPRGSYQSAAELESNGTWDVILGEPDQYFTDEASLPTDPLMRESVEPRSGQNPITGDPIAPPGSAVNANPINGHEYTINNDDLQYTCIFPLIQPRDCALTSGACDCNSPNNDNPLCQNEDNTYGTVQRRAKAYPGLRHLQLLRELEDRAVLGSICPAQIQNSGRRDFGYLPVVRSLIEVVAPILE